MTSSRAYLAVLGVLLAGGMLLLVASGVTWGEAEATGRAVPVVSVSGRDVLPAAQAVGLLALAAVVAIHASRRWGRRVIGGVLAVAGAGIVVGSYLIALELPNRVLRYADGPDGTGGFDAASVSTGGPMLAAAGGLLVAVAGLGVMVVGPRWPGMGSRYVRGPETGRAAPGAPERTPDRDRDAWKALDRGEDPTA